LRIVLDPTVVDAGIAVVSAAAGAASQFPRIQQLERELKSAKDSLTKSEEELVSKITELEDKLFHMDQEYEQATTRFKKQYDTKMKEDLERVADKMKVDFQYKLEIRLEEQKSKLLQDQLGLVNGLTGGRQEELVNLRLRNSRVQKANQELEQALEMSKLELERIQAGAQKKGWWPF
jgi:alanyl-tRNA synthetase